MMKYAMKQGWKIMKLGEVCKVIAGQSPRGNAYNDKGVGVEFHQGKKAFGKDVIQPSGVWTTEITKMAEAGDILMSVRAPVGPTNFTDRSVCIGRGLAAIRCSELVLPQFILYALKNIENKIVGKDGAVFNSISKDMIEDLPVPKLSLSEQQRIVALLDAEFAKIDALKANAEKNLQNAKDLFQAALKKELEPKEGWKKSIVGNVCSIISGYAFDSQGYSSNENDTLLICGDNIVHCAFRWETIKRWNKDKYEDLRRFAIQENDIVLAMDRPWVKSGLKIAKVSKRELPSLLIQRTACIRAKEGIESEFIYFALQNDAFSKYLIEQQTGVGVPHISGKQIMNYEISLPSLPIQQSIVSRLDTLNEKCKALQANYEKTLSLCDDLKQALLRKAFNGEI